MGREILLVVPFLMILISSYKMLTDDQATPAFNKLTFKPGEELTYKVHYGFINAATAKMQIDAEAHYVNGIPCYKIDIFGKSTGMFDLLMGINDNWGTYLDTANFRPTRFYRTLEEGKYRKNEIVTFDQKKHVAVTKEFSFSQNSWKPILEHKVPSNVQDLVSGYYYVRTLDFTKLSAGDLIEVDAFFDKEVFKFKIRVVGREEVKTNLGKIRSIVLSPVMPENSLFDGENSIRIWLSDDVNKVPLKIKADMFVGAVEIDILTFKQGKVK